MTLVDHVASRYKRASGSLWDSAVDDVKSLNTQYEKLRKLSDPTSIDARKVLKSLSLNFASCYPGLYDWVMKCTNVSNLQLTDFPKSTMVMTGNQPYDEYLQVFKAFRDSVQDLIRTVAPQRFSYQGFAIENPEGMTEEVAMMSLEGVDYLVALFKQRGMTPLLSKGVSVIRLRVDLGNNAVGNYRQTNQEIQLSVSKLMKLGGTSGRFITWVKEVLLHEFGHYVHLNYLSTEAKESWDSGWDDVKAKQEALKEAFKLISSGETDNFFKLLVASGWKPEKVVKQLDAIQVVKFAYWLRSTQLNNTPLITPKSFKWNKDGQLMARFFLDPKKFMEDERGYTPADDKYEEMLGRVRTHYYEDTLNMGKNLPISDTTVSELSKADPTLQNALDLVMDDLEIVSDYGKTNEVEDFAETFVAFLAAPEKLTSTAKFRMQRALSLSGFYNKPVMRLAEKDLVTIVASRYLVSLFEVASYP